MTDVSNQDSDSQELLGGSIECVSQWSCMLKIDLNEMTFSMQVVYEGLSLGSIPVGGRRSM
jgi:hypothetical protein